MYNGPTKEAPREEPGEIFFWREEYDFFKDASPEAASKDSEVTVGSTEELDDFMTQIAEVLGLGRGQKLILDSAIEVLKREAKYSSRCRVPTLNRSLSTELYEIPLGIRQRPWEQPVHERCSTVIVLQPASDRPVTSNMIPKKTSTLAQHFIKMPSKKWLSSQRSQLQFGIPICKKMLTWARMMLVNKDDREILQRADIYRGVLASLYPCNIDPSLVAAFLTYWNVDSHTLLTSQGEMGYPLHTLSDAMGVPFVGRLYEEYIPLAPAVNGHVKSLYSIYTGLCPVALQLHLTG